MTTLTKKVMRRVYVIWGVRYVLPRLVLSMGFFMVAWRVTAERFFVEKVFSNFLNVSGSNVWAIPQFIESALNHAEPQILILISASGVAGFFLAVKLLRSIRSIVREGNISAVFQKAK